MEPQYWLERWQHGRIEFHDAQANPKLLANYRVFDESVRVLVPLCGKSVDLEWLVVHGYEVVGIELSELAVQAFFSERNLTPERRQEGAFVRYQHGGITIFAGDFFATTSEQLGLFDGAYDCAAMIALPDDLRGRYTRHLRTLLTPKSKLLLITLHYDAAGGPPFSVSPADVAAAYSDAKITHLESSDASQEMPALLKAGATYVHEDVYAIEFGATPSGTIES